MTTEPQGIQRILVIGGGRGGTAMLDLFSEDPMIKIVGIFDTDPQASALALAKEMGIQIFTNLAEAIEASSPCFVFNLTGDESVTVYVTSQLGSENIVGGFQARLFWNLLTRLKNTNEQITHLAYYDFLTKLPNRMLFYDRLNQAITMARRNKESIAVLFIDVDGFKTVNDTLGHDVGDELLRQVSKRITSCVRDSDTVARMGGDEFTVILANKQTQNSTDHVANKIVEAFVNPIVLNGKNCLISVSIGIAFYPDNGDTAEQLVKISDAAMYLAKHSGKNCYRFTAS